MNNNRFCQKASRKHILNQNAGKELNNFSIFESSLGIVGGALTLLKATKEDSIAESR